jgi:hypothetical protein
MFSLLSLGRSRFSGRFSFFYVHLVNRIGEATGLDLEQGFCIRYSKYRGRFEPRNQTHRYIRI